MLTSACLACVAQLINKKDPRQVRYLMMTLLKLKMPVQVAFLQGMLPLQHDDLFPRLLDLIAQCPIWSLNLGELRFSEEQCAKLADALRLSGVTHLFYECTVAGQWKEVYRELIRQNRAKHGMWRLGPDAEQNRVVLSAVKCWYCPTSHKANKQWVARNALGWTNVERVQCEGCGKWRRLSSSLNGWPRVFYCALNTWDTRFAACDAAEEEWERDQPMNGDSIVCELSTGLWLEGSVAGQPRANEFALLPRIGMPPPPPAEAKPEAVVGSSDKDPFSCMLFSSRSRKPTQLYDASTTSTEYTKQLRVHEKEEETLRRDAIAVKFIDGVTRCVQLDPSSRGKSWVLGRDWAAHMSRVRKAVPPPKAAAFKSGRVVLYRVDGRGWRRVRLVRPVSEPEWRHIRDERLGAAAAEENVAAAAACATAAACADDSCGLKVRCTKPPEAVKRCASGEKPKKMAMTPPPPPPPPRLPPLSEKARANWWRCEIVSAARRRRRRVLLELCEASRIFAWHAPADVSNECGTALHGEDVVEEESEGEEEVSEAEGEEEAEEEEEAELPIKGEEEEEEEAAGEGEAEGETTPEPLVVLADEVKEVQVLSMAEVEKKAEKKAAKEAEKEAAKEAAKARKLTKKAARAARTGSEAGGPQLRKRKSADMGAGDNDLPRVLLRLRRRSAE